MEAWVSFDKNIGLIYLSSVNLTNLVFFFLKFPQNFDMKLKNTHWYQYLPSMKI
jgi:hypothetical protein